MKSGRQRVLLAAAVFLLLSRTALAASVTIAWDPNTEPDLAGYMVRYGDHSQTYTMQVDAGKATKVTVNSLQEGKTYYFAVQAYTTDGMVSPLSDEVQAYISLSNQVLAPAAPAPPDPSRFTSVPGADGRLPTRVVSWTTVADAQAYYLYVGYSPGAKDIVNTGEIQSTSYTLPALSFDGTYFARIYTKQAGVWRYTEQSFKLPQTGTPSRMVAPLNGQRNVTSAQVFQWEAVARAQAYYLYVGTNSGDKDLIDTGETTRTWWTTASLPAGRHLYARIWTKIDGLWYWREIEFDSAPRAVLIYPYQQASDTSAYETFAWTAVTDAQAYYLYVGTSPGAKDIVDTGETKATSYQVNGLEPGRTLYARIYTLVKGVWEMDAVTFTTSLSARFTKPMAGDGSDLGQGLAWTTILGADAYYLYVGTGPGKKDIVDTGEIARTDYETPALPAGQQVYARIYTKYGGLWRQREKALTLAGAALTSPAADATGAATIDVNGELFTWTTITNAEAYYLYVGTQPGAKDVVDTGEIHTTSYLVKNLPHGRRLYVSIWTKANGVWNGTSSTFVTR
jgi:hypothetical protein